jgi:hypothetical protein
MIKVHGVLADGVVLQDKATRDSGQAREGVAAEDKMTISRKAKEADNGPCDGHHIRACWKKVR